MACGRHFQVPLALARRGTSCFFFADIHAGCFACVVFRNLAHLVSVLLVFLRVFSRPTEVVVDQAYIGYKIIAQHRNHWQGIGGILESKASLTTYCLEVAKQLKMRYHAPPLPVDLHMAGTAASALAALQGNNRRGSGLDKRKLDEALKASNRRTRGSHQAFAESDD